MIPADVLQRQVDALPEPVLDYLYSERAGELNFKIIENHQLAEAQEEKLFPLLRELFVKALLLERLISELKSRLGLDDTKAKALAVDIAGYRLLPLDKWLGDVSAYLRANGADPKNFPAFRVAVTHRTMDEAAKEVASSLASETDPHLQNRLENVVESVLAGIRTEAQATDVLTRPEKIGGVGLDPKSAAHVLEEIHEETRAVVLDHDMPAAWKKEEPTAKVSGPAQAKDGSLTITPEDALELAQFKKTPAPKEFDQAVQEIYLASGLQTEDEALAKRIKTIIGNRLRDVRDQMETLEILTQPKELGGLNLGQDAARALLGKIQAFLRKNETAGQARVQTDKTKWVEAERRQKALSETQENVDQKTELERLYQSIVTKSKKASVNAPAPVMAHAPIASDGKTVAPANLPIAVANPVPPSFRPPAPPVTAPSPAPPRPTLPPPMTMVKPARETPMAAPPAPAAFHQRPKLEDVKVAPALTGPVEELRALTIVDFRRFSKDPKEACLKIKGKIDLLADQSYTRRTEGIAAWTASEVVRTYLELMRESLNGKPLLEAIGAREAAKKPALTADEFRAVSDLNRQLRY